MSALLADGLGPTSRDENLSHLPLWTGIRMAIIKGKEDIKLTKDQLAQQQPKSGVYERLGNKMKTDGGLILEKCLN